MPVRDWVRYGALAALILAVVASAGTLWVYRQGQTEQRQEAASYSSEIADQQSYDPCARLSGFVDGLNCVFREVKGSRENQRAEYDLKAQQDMAAWALALLIVSALGLMVTTVGVVYVAMTFRETRRMVEEASRSNDAAMIAARAAQESVKVAVTSQRPWVGMDNIKTKPEYPEVGREFRITATLRNAGQSPARRFRAYFDDDPVAIDYLWAGIEPLPEQGEGRVSVGLLIPNATFSIELVIPAERLTQSLIDRLATPDKTEQFAIFIRGRTDYLDMTEGQPGRKCHTTICMYYSVESRRFGYCITGNEAN